MTTSGSREADDKRGALEAVERILNRGGEAEDVLAAVVAALHARFSYVSIRCPGNRFEAGREADGVVVPVELEERTIGELELSTDDGTFARRVATLVSAQLDNVRPT